MTPELLREAGPFLITLTSVLSLLGGGFWRVWSKISKRIDDLEDDVVAAQADVAACKERDAEKERKLHTMGLCLRLLIPEVSRLDPGSAVLRQVGALLDQSFPVDPDMPPDMVALLDNIDTGKPRRAAGRRKV